MKKLLSFNVALKEQLIIITRKRFVQKFNSMQVEMDTEGVDKQGLLKKKSARRLPFICKRVHSGIWEYFLNNNIALHYVHLSSPSLQEMKFAQKFLYKFCFFEEDKWVYYAEDEQFSRWRQMPFALEINTLQVHTLTTHTYLATSDTSFEQIVHWDKSTHWHSPMKTGGFTLSYSPPSVLHSQVIKSIYTN